MLLPSTVSQVPLVNLLHRFHGPLSPERENVSAFKNLDGLISPNMGKPPVMDDIKTLSQVSWSVHLCGAKGEELLPFSSLLVLHFPPHFPVSLVLSYTSSVFSVLSMQRML